MWLSSSWSKAGATPVARGPRLVLDLAFSWRETRASAGFWTEEDQGLIYILEGPLELAQREEGGKQRLVWGCGWERRAHSP